MWIRKSKEELKKDGIKNRRNLFLTILFSLFAEGNLNDPLAGTEVICLKCGETKRDDGNFVCKCGGEMEYIKKLKWVDDEEGKQP